MLLKVKAQHQKTKILLMALEILGLTMELSSS